MEDNYDNKTGVYTVPVTGYYRLSATVVRYTPTGEYETIRNPYRKWFQVWKQKIITKKMTRLIRQRI
jgi:hypothetical protein